jgi:hypothetical protein
MSRVAAYCLALCLCTPCARLSIAQDDVAQRLIEVCNRIEANRSRVLTYAVDIRSVYRDSYESEGPNKTINRLIMLRYHIIADHTHDSMLIVYYARDLLKPSRLRSPVIYLRNGDGEFASRLGRMLAIRDPEDFAFFVDPILMGLTLGRFAGEGTGPLDDKLRAMRRSADLQYRAYTESDGLLTFYKEPAERNIAPAKQEISSFDNLREFEPVEYRSKEGKDPNDFHRIQTESTEVEGIYLPTRSYSKNGGRHWMFELDWVFVNRPIPPSLFDPEVVKALLNPPVPADGNPATFDEPFFQDLLR